MLYLPILLSLALQPATAPNTSIPLEVERIVMKATNEDSLEAIEAIDRDANSLPFLEEIENTSARFRLPASLIAGIIQEESSYNAWAERSERAYARNRKVRRRARQWSAAHGGIPSVRTELEDRARSMGAMQVMGEVARAQGFRERYLSALFLPAHSIDQGGLLLRHLLDRYPHDTLSAISAYNSGSAKKHHGVFDNARYVYRVTIAWQAYKKLFASTRRHLN